MTATAGAGSQLGGSGEPGIDESRSTASTSSAVSPLRSSPNTTATGPRAEIIFSAAARGVRSGRSRRRRAVVPTESAHPERASGKFVQIRGLSSSPSACTATRRADSKSSVRGSTTAQCPIPAQRSARAAAPRFTGFRGRQRTKRIALSAGASCTDSLLHVLEEPCHLILHALAQVDAQHAESLHVVVAARDEVEELFARADLVQPRLLAADEHEAVEVASVRLDQGGLEALDLPLRLQPAVVPERLLEHLARLLLAAGDGTGPTDQDASACGHEIPLSWTAGAGLAPPAV